MRISQPLISLFKNCHYLCKKFWIYQFSWSFLILHMEQTKLQGFPISLLNTFKSSFYLSNPWSAPSSFIREFYSSSSLRFILLLPELASNVCSSCPSVINALPVSDISPCPSAPTPSDAPTVNHFSYVLMKLCQFSL